MITVGVEAHDARCGSSPPTTPDAAPAVIDAARARASSTTSSTTGRRRTATGSSCSRTPTAPRTSELWSTPVGDAGREHWTELVAHREDVRLDDVDAFARPPRRSSSAPTGSSAPRPRAAPTTRARRSRCPTRSYSAWARRQPRVRHDDVRLRVHVARATAVDASTTTSTPRRSTLVQEQPVLGGYDREPTTRSAAVWATATDGTQVPISVVHRRDVALDGSAPVLLYGYGAYEISIDPTFSIVATRLLDRGFVFAIAHVRGGGELGRPLVRGRQARAQAQHVHRLHRVRRAPGRARATRRRTGSRRAAAAPAGCSWARSPTCVPTCSRDRRRGAVRRRASPRCSTPTLPLTVTEWEEWGNPLDDPERLRVHEGVLAVRQRRREAAYPRCS